MRKFISITMLLVLYLVPTACFAQWKNNVWIYGRNHGNTSWPWWGGTKLLFENNGVSITEEFNIQMNINSTYTGLVSADNNYFVYTNGYTVANKNHDTLVNGTGLSPGGTYANWSSLGNPTPCSALLLPFPGSDNLMVLLHTDNFAQGSYHAKNMYYSLIDPSSNNGQGEVMIKNQLLVHDTLTIGGITANRHANGRDWWILLKRNYQNDFFTFLLSPTGIELKQIQAMGGIAEQLGGQNNFSPDGSKFAGFSNSYQLRIYDFDRCSGQLSNLIYKFITPYTGGGLAFSPNNRFLYINNYEKLWQFDLESNDILNSQTLLATYDTSFVDPSTGMLPGFGFMYLAADGKIYFQNFNGVMLHVISNPDMPGLSCNFVQNQIQCPTYYYLSVPTYVNLNLMQEPGSPCDTLGVGNEELKTNNLQLKIAPNPSNGNISIEYPVQEISGMLYVYDVNGKLVYNEYVSPYTYIKNINLHGKLSSGMYAVSLVFGQQRYLGKVVVE
jgi:hypothetical protein